MSKETNQEEQDPKKISASKPLVDELDVDGIQQGKYFAHGRLLSAATRQMPVVEFSDEALVMHPPEKPFDDNPAETVKIEVDDRGVLLDDAGKPKRVAGAGYEGKSIWWFGERKPGTLKHYAVWFDDSGLPHKLSIQNEPITTDVVYKLRNRTHDGELSKFPDLVSD